MNYTLVKHYYTICASTKTDSLNMQFHSQQSTTDLVLIGGGHSHLNVIKAFGLNPIPGVRVIVISKDVLTPYSGMLPGLIAGHYTSEESHIDLRWLCEQAGADFYNREVDGIDLEKKRVLCKEESPVEYDFLSINTGSKPALSSIPGAQQYGVAVKPIAAFLNQWNAIVSDIEQTSGVYSIGVVGGGAASVEVAFACRYQLQHLLGKSASRVTFNLYCASEALLPGYTDRVRNYVQNTLEKQGIYVRLNHIVREISDDIDSYQLSFSNGSNAQVNKVIWAIHAGSPAWIKQTGLYCTDDGFVKVNPHLQSESHDNIFAAGDIAHFGPQPLAKSGVYAVRAGEYLSDNLRHRILGKPLTPFRPQRRFLSIITTGSKYAIASKGRFALRGKWVWRWKDAIDKKFMTKFKPRKNNA